MLANCECHMLVGNDFMLVGNDFAILILESSNKVLFMAHQLFTEIQIWPSMCVLETACSAHFKLLVSMIIRNVNHSLL